MKANMKSVRVQISALTQMMDKLIQSHWAKKYQTASSREHQILSVSPLTDGPGITRTMPLCPNDDSRILTRHLLITLRSWQLPSVHTCHEHRHSLRNDQLNNVVTLRMILFLKECLHSLKVSNWHLETCECDLYVSDILAVYKI